MAELDRVLERRDAGWHARHPTMPPHAHLVEAVDGERERLTAEIDASNARLREESRANLAAHGIDSATAAEMTGAHRSWPRLRVN